MQLICTIDNIILKIILYDFFKEIEYHKNEWGILSREIVDKDIAYQNPFIIINHNEFNLIHSLSIRDYYRFDYKNFLIKNGLEHYLI